MLKFLLKLEDVLYEVSIDLGEINSFYSSFSDKGQKDPSLPFKSSKKPAWYRVKIKNNTLMKQYESSGKLIYLTHEPGLSKKEKILPKKFVTLFLKNIFQRKRDFVPIGKN